jgi:hypothetical protein
MSTAAFDTLTNRAATLTVPVETLVQGSSKSWLNLNGTGTIALRDSFNISSMVDNGTGDYTQNFTANRPNANYAVAGTTAGTATAILFLPLDTSTARTAALFRFFCATTAGAAIDAANVNAQSVGDET